MTSANNRPTPDVVDEATEALRETAVPAGPPPELIAATLASIDNRLAGTVPIEPVPRFTRRRIMRYMGFGAATAAAVALGVVVWSPGRSAAAMFETAMDNVGKANSMRAVITTTAGPDMTFEMKLYGQGDRFRNEMDMGKEMGSFVIIVDGTRKKGLHLALPGKTAKWLDFTGKEGQAAADKTGLGGIFGGLKGKAVEVLPDEIVDGRKLKVFTRKGHKLGDQGVADLTVWIDPKRELPVKCRIELTNGEVKAVSVMTILGWNEELDDSLFELKIPEGYQEVKE